MISVVFFLNSLFSVLACFTLVDLDECKVTHKGAEYLGKNSQTRSNITCQDWCVATQKVSEVILDEEFPDGSKIQARNYCRNPNNNPKGPWCYTMMGKQIFDNCDVPLCKSPDCRFTGPGMEYSGLIEKTASGKVCTNWTDKHIMRTQLKEQTFEDRFFPDGSVKQAGRKCRNPDGNLSGPWCYVKIEGSDLHEKEVCEIPFCDDIGNLMYSEGSSTGEYFFFSSINGSQALNISFRLWNPSNWFHGQVFLYLSAYDVALERDAIERWNSGIEIKFSNKGSGVLSTVLKGKKLMETPMILSGAKWSDLAIVWRNVCNRTLHIRIYEKSKVNPIGSYEIPIQKTLLELENFRYISLGGSPAFWNIPSSIEVCAVHTVTDMKFTRFWIIKKSNFCKNIEFFVRAKRNANIVLREVPMSGVEQVQVTFTEEDTIRVFFCNRSQAVNLGEVYWPNVLSLWKWEYFKITLNRSTLQMFWVNEAVAIPLIEVSHKSIESLSWVTFASPRVSYWTIYCDPRGNSDPPPNEPPECVLKENEAFKGKLSITSSGRQCIPWVDKYSLPVKYRNDRLFEPYGGRISCQNFCRNLDRDTHGAYCLVKSSLSETGFDMEHCYPRSCHQSDCKVAGTGNDYIGNLNVTRSKRACRPWWHVTNSYVHVDDFPDRSLKEAKNYCRNPSKSAVGTWCYTTDSRVPRDVCYIKDCDKPLECTVLTSGYAKNTFVYILPSWRKNGLQFSLKAWNPDIYEGLLISLFSLDRSTQYELLIGDQNNEKITLLYKDNYSEFLLLHKTLPHSVPVGKWKGYWLRPSHGKIELGYQGVPNSFFEWSDSGNEMAFTPMFINYGTTKNYWVGVNFQCSECLTTETSSQEGYKIYPINLWHEDTSNSRLRLNLRGKGSAFITLLWTPNFQKVLAVQIVSNATSIFIVKFRKEKEKEIIGTFTVPSTIVENEWSEFTIGFTENSLMVYKGTIQLLEWVSPFPLLIYWFAVTAEGGVITWTANCPAPDIDGEPRDGSWGRWGPWSCSVSCGKGRGRITRECDDPPPNVFGNECKGSAVYEGPCNDFPCGKISPDTNNIIRQYLSTQHKSLQVDVSERVVLPCNPQARELIAAEVSEMNITWTHNGFPYSRTRFHMDENYSLVISRAQEKHCGIYLCMVYQDPESIPSKIVLEVISLVVIKQKPTKKIRKGRSLTLKCNGLALSYVYADLSQQWELNGIVWKDYGLGTLQTFTVDKLENISDWHEGVWTCVIIQEDFKFKWTTNWLYLKVKSAPSFWSHLMEDVATAPLFGKLGNERNAMILFFALTGAAIGVILLVIVQMVKWLKN